MSRVLIISMIGLVAVCAAACNEAQSPTSPSESGVAAAIAPASQTSTAGDLSFCVAEVNRYRATVGLRALAQSPALEAFAAVAAENDHRTKTEHQWFGLTRGGGISRSEIEILWWLDRPVHDVIKDGLAQIWRVGPGGTHYEVIVGRFTETGCGVFVRGSEVTVAQEFR